MAIDKKYNVALVLDDGLDKPDGVQQYILGIGSWLKKQGHSVDYLVGQTSRRDIIGLVSMSRNIRVSSNGNSMTIPLPTSYKKIKHQLKIGRYDILHVQTPYSPFMGGRLIKKADNNTAVIGTFHILPNNKLIFIGNWLLGIYCRRTLRRFDKMLSVSNVAKDFAKKTFQIDSEVLPNVIEYERFNKAKPIPKYNDNIFNILFLGRLVPRKGCITLLKAVLDVSKEQLVDKTFRVIICGTGSEEKHLRRFVEVNKMQDLVTFEGFVDEKIKPNYYASADLAVFPSSGGESFGIVLLEAMANSRTAVIAGDNPGYRSVLEEQPDTLFDPKNPKDLAQIIAQYMNNDIQRKQLAQWQSEYTKNFDTDVVGTQLIGIYESTLRNRNNQ